MIQIKKTILTLVALIAVTTQAWAQTDVSTFADLQTALSAGNDVKLTANISFTSAITISGSKKITIDGNGKTMSGPSTRAFSISSGNTLVIKNATLNNFDLNAGGGAIRNNGTLVLDGCTVSNNHTDGNGQGGGAIENQGTLYASNTTFSGNYSSEIGGAINNYGGKLYLSGCTFTNNYTTSSNAKYGGAIGNNSSNTVVIVNCTFSGNKYGGSNGSASDLGVFRTPNDYTIAGCTGIAIEGATLTTYQYGTVTLDYSDLSAISFTYDQSDTPIAVASPVEVAWNKATKTGTFTMPGGNVTVTAEYYPQAALTAAPTAINDVPATTDGAIVKAGTVANIGSTETAQGTVMYYVSPTALDDAALLALAADKWTADVPTAEKLTKGEAYVYYYVRGNDSDTDEENFSDGDILAANALTVTIAAEPTYAVTFAEGTDPNEWTANPAADVKKGTEVKVTYTGSKKVIGVKAEKKSAAAAPRPLAEAVAADLGKIAGADGNIYDTKAAAEAANTTAVAMIAYVGSASDCTHGLAIALADESGTKTWSEAGAACSGKTAVTGGTWRLPSIKDWQYMFIGCGASGSYSDSPSTMSYSELATKLTTANGTALQTLSYWSSTESSPGEDAWSLYFGGSSASFFSGDYEGDAYPIRACLVF